MKSGPSDFRLEINELAIAEIADRAEKLRSAALTNFMMTGAPLEDIMVLTHLLAFKEFLEDRNCLVDFKIQLKGTNE